MASVLLEQNFKGYLRNAALVGVRTASPPAAGSALLALGDDAGGPRGARLADAMRTRAHQGPLFDYRDIRTGIVALSSTSWVVPPMINSQTRE